MMSVRDTSVNTYREIIGERTVAKTQRQVLRLIAERPGFTDREIAEMLGYKDPNNVRPRRKELLDAGLILESGKRRCGKSGRVAYTWKINYLFRLTPEKIKKKCESCEGKGFVYE